MATGFKQATVNASDVPATQSNYPAYVDLSRLGITTQSEADSVRCYSDSGKTTELAREIVSTSVMWVKIPSLTSSFTLYVDWDDTSSDYAATDTYGRNAVWSDYGAVWHMDNDPSGTAPQLVDSTGNSNSGTSAGTMTSGDVVAGKIGNGTDFDGTDDRYTGSDSASLSPTSGLTLQAWVKLDAFDGSTVDRFYHKNQSGSATDNQVLSFVGAKLFFRFQDSGGTLRSVTGATTLSTATWYMLHGTYDGSTVDGYVNGSSDVTPLSIASGITNSTGTWQIDGFNGANNTPDGIIDEVRVRGSALSTNWITTEYNNQSDESGFWGTWTTVSAGGFAYSQAVIIA